MINFVYVVFYSYKVSKISRYIVIYKKSFRKSKTLRCSTNNPNVEPPNPVMQNSFWLSIRKNRNTIFIYAIFVFVAIVSVRIFIIRTLNFSKSLVIYIQKNDTLHRMSSQTVVTTARQLFNWLLSMFVVVCISSWIIQMIKEYRFALQRVSEEKFNKNETTRYNFLSFRNFAVVSSLLYLVCIVFLTLAGITVPSALGPFYFKLAELLISAVIIAPGVTVNSAIMSSISMFIHLVQHKKPIIVTTMSRDDGLLYYLAICPPKVVANKQIIEAVLGVRSSADSTAFIGTVEYTFPKILTVGNVYNNRTFWYFFWHLVYTELAIKINTVLYSVPYLPVVKVEKTQVLESKLEGVFDLKLRECEPNWCFPEKLVDDTIQKLGLSIEDLIVGFCWIRVSSFFCTTSLLKDFETYKLKDFEIRETDRKEKLSYLEYKKRKQ